MCGAALISASVAITHFLGVVELMQLMSYGNAYISIRGSNIFHYFKSIRSNDNGENNENLQVAIIFVSNII